MTFRMAMSLAFLTALIFVGFKSITGSNSVMMGMTILCYGWVATQIISEGFVALIWLLFKRIIEKTLEQNSDDDIDKNQ